MRAAAKMAEGASVTATEAVAALVVAARAVGQLAGGHWALVAAVSPAQASAETEQLAAAWLEKAAAAAMALAEPVRVVAVEARVLAAVAREAAKG